MSKILKGAAWTLVFIVLLAALGLAAAVIWVELQAALGNNPFQ